MDSIHVLLIKYVSKAGGCIVAKSVTYASTCDGSIGVVARWVEVFLLVLEVPL